MGRPRLSVIVIQGRGTFSPFCGLDDFHSHRTVCFAVSIPQGHTLPDAVVQGQTPLWVPGQPSVFSL